MSVATATIVMPRLSDSMEEGTVVRWLKQPGDVVARGDELVEVETDKATMTYEAEVDGVLGKLLAGAGDTVALGAPIAELDRERGDAGPATAPGRAAPLPPQRAPAVPVTPPREPPAPVASPADGQVAIGADRDPAGGRPKATPVARRVARHLGVALERVQGSGRRGRIVRADVEAAARSTPATGPAPQPVAAGKDTVVELSSLQRTVARRMVRSRSEIPEFTLTAELDVTDALAFRRQLAELHDDARVSVNDLLVKAVALVLREQPALNASWVEDRIVRHGRVNVGVAVAAADALLVPVVHDADRLPLPELAAATRALGERARERSVTPADLEGATFTVTNLGMFGVLSFSAVIDVPQVAILAVGTTTRRPMFVPGEETVAGRDLLQVSLSCDHRAVYGADGARFLARLREVLENPMTLLLGLPAANDTRS